MKNNLIKLDYKSKRSFGVELEIIKLNTSDVEKLFSKNGIKYSTGYGKKYDKWRIKDDGSIEDNSYSTIACTLCPTSRNTYCYTCSNTRKVRNYSVQKTCEVVSPILSGKKGLEQLEYVCKLLKKAGAKVNTTCGLHVHVNAKDKKEKELINVYNRYASFESEIDKWIHSTRRGNGNSYCYSPNGNDFFSGVIEMNINIKNVQDLKSYIKSLNDLFVENNKKELLLTDKEKKIKNKIINYYFENDRHNKLNLAAFNKYGTIEFRHHHGSIDFIEISHWVKFCVEFFETSFKKQSITEKDTVFSGINVKTKRYLQNKNKPLKNKKTTKRKAA